MADVPKRFANHGDNRRFIHREFPCGLNVQRKSRPRPTENGLANFAPLRFCRYFDNNDAGPAASRISKRNMNVAPMPSRNRTRFTILLVATRQRSSAQSFH